MNELNKSIFKSLIFYLQLIISAVLILWGLESSGKVFTHPELMSSWSKFLFVIIGIIIGARACYVKGKGAIILGLTLLVFAGIYLWNMQYYFGYENITKTDILRIFGIPLAVLIIFGVFFSVFFRYLYSNENLSKAKLDNEKITSTETLKNEKTESKNPWVRLILLAASAGLALLVGFLSGIEEPVGRTKIIMSVLILGCVATGLISENILSKISSWLK